MNTLLLSHYSLITLYLNLIGLKVLLMCDIWAFLSYFSCEGVPLHSTLSACRVCPLTLLCSEFCLPAKHMLSTPDDTSQQNLPQQQTIINPHLLHKPLLAEHHVHSLVVKTLSNLNVKLQQVV